MFETLTDRFEGILTRLRGRGRLTDADVEEVLREIRTALLEADVEIGVVRTFTGAVRERCVGLELSKNLSPGQQVIKIVNEELIGILGGETLKITYAGRPPTVVLLAGLQGSGKTTTAAKLAALVQEPGTHIRCSLARTFSAPLPSNSCGCSAPRPASRCSANRPIRCRSRPRASRRPDASAGTW